MFDRIFDWIDRGWGWIKPWFVVDVYEGVGVLRFGRYHRTCGPGFHWKIPFCEKPIEITTCETTWHSPPQPLTTKDDVPVSVTTVVRYEVVDVRPYISLIHDQGDVLADRTMGAVRRLVAKSTYRELLEAEEPEKEVATALRRAVNRYGFKIHEVTFIAFTRARSINLISSTFLKDLAN